MDVRGRSRCRGTARRGILGHIHSPASAAAASWVGELIELIAGELQFCTACRQLGRELRRAAVLHSCGLSKLQLWQLGIYKERAEGDCCPFSPVLEAKH